MSENIENSNDYLLEVFILESNQLIEQLEEIMLNSEKDNKISIDDVDEIFRIMHTIKGSAAMMSFNNISSAAHALEDLFDYIRNNPNGEYNDVFDIVLSTLDFIKAEIAKVESGNPSDGNERELIDNIKALLNTYKNKSGKNDKTSDKLISGRGIKGEKVLTNSKKYSARIFFEKDCLMENLRALSLVCSLKDVCGELYYYPADIADNNQTCEYIAENGFYVFLTTDESQESISELLDRGICVESFNLESVDNFKEYDKLMGVSSKDDSVDSENDKNDKETASSNSANTQNTQNNFININITKLDKLLDLIGEIVITESIVTKNADKNRLKQDSFSKAARQLRKLIEELQDSVMSIRMVPIAPTFTKMNRIVRDMGKKLGKDVNLVISGGDTEVDKNIINHISDPLMHIIRNSMDHGIESKEKRISAGKPEKGTITLSASNEGGEVLIKIADDGGGLDPKKILKRAKMLGLLNKPEDELSEKEIFNLILSQGFSTKDNVSEYSGRGVGMDVVQSNVKKIGGRIFLDSVQGKGLTVLMRIPLTLTIIEGMNITVGENIFTIPTISIREFFNISGKEILMDNNGNEMVIVRGNCYPVLRLHKYYEINTDVVDLKDGIIVMVEMDEKTVCLFADKLLGEQQIVIKPLPYYLTQFPIKESGISGCSILGDGNISLVLDVKEIIETML